MADKSFGVKELNLLNASGTPTVTSPNNLNLNANTVAISTSVTIGQNLTVSANAGIASLNVTGIATVVNFNATGVSTIAQPSNTNAHSAWLVTANGTSAYRFTGPGQDGSDDDPDVYLVRGQRYIFTNNSGGSHPFQIRVASGGAAYSTGVTNNGASSGNIIFNVQHDAPAQLFYQCTSHSGMVGNIYIVGGPQVISGVVTATTFSGSGANLTSLPAANLTGTLPTISGANLTGVLKNVVEDTSPQLGADLDTNSFEILFDDAHAAKFGNSSQLQIKHDGSGGDARIINTVGNLYSINSTNGWIILQPVSGQTGINVKPNAAVELMHSGNLSLQTAADGGVKATGNYIVGTSGRGLQFNTSDSGSSELLDDYEEGNYNISITGSGGGTVDLQSTINNLRYTKIGRMVHVMGRIYINGSTNPSGTARMNLPFTSAANSNDQNGQGYSYVTRYNIYSPNNDWALIFEIEPNVSYGVFLWDKPNAAWDGVNAASELNQNAGYLGFDFTYTTAT